MKLLKLFVKTVIKFYLIKKLIIKCFYKLYELKIIKFDAFKKFDKRFYGTNLSLPRIEREDYNKMYILTDIDFKLPNNVVHNYEKIKSSLGLEPESIKKSYFFILFNSDSRALNELKNIIKNEGYYKSLNINYNELHVDFNRSTSYRFTDESCLKALQLTYSQVDKISHFEPATIITHENICEGINLTKNVEGDYLEIGVYKGGTALTALNYIKETNSKKRSFLLDTFEGFNYEESKKSLDVKWNNTHKIYEESKMKKYLYEVFKEHKNYELITNNICKDELPANINKISLAHIDVDIYEATLSAIKKVSKRLSKYGIIMCEDPAATPYLYGAYYAMEEFMNSNEGKKFIKIFKKTHYFLIKIN